jgi:hypothetical protein
VEVQPEIFRRVRETPGRFVVLPGHEDARTEEVVERGETHLVVEKRKRSGTAPCGKGSETAPGG